jgi:ATP-dependent Clp protease ATP-binding subunit ClpA
MRRERVKDEGTVTVTKEMIQAQVSRVAGVPVDRLQNERSAKIVDLESNIKQKLYGQDSVLWMLCWNVCTSTLLALATQNVPSAVSCSWAQQAQAKLNWPNC